jgi:hypothetical protein
MENITKDQNTEGKADEVSFLDFKNRTKYEEKESQCDIHDEECLSCGS